MSESYFWRVGGIKMIKRIKVYLFLKKLGVNHPWKASGDKRFCQF
jgi:hypothetical protein